MSAAAVSETIECSICYDVFCNNNVSITPCGHKFCFSCIIKAVSYNKECPICRSRLAEESEDEEDDDESDGETIESEDDEDYDEDDDEDSDEDEMPVPDTYEFAERLEQRGFRMVDIVSILHCTRSRMHHTFEQFKELSKNYDEVCDELYNEKQENFMFGKEDKNALHMAHGAATACCSV